MSYKYIILILSMITPNAIAGEFTRETSNGALYNIKTHYCKDGKVFMRPQFVGLRGEEKREVYKAIGITIGGYDHQKWLDAQERWKQELEGRHALRVKIAQEYASKRRERIHQNSTIQNRTIVYQYYPSPTYFSYWNGYRNNWNGYRNNWNGYRNYWGFYYGY